MKKILIILSEDLTKNGGVQEYTKKILNFFKCQFDFEILYFSNYKKNFDSVEWITNVIISELIQGNNKVSNVYNILKYFKKKEKLILEFLKDKNYYKIINMSPFYFKKISKRENYYQVQHNEIKYYNLFFKADSNKQKIIAIFAYIFGYRNPIKKSKNIVLFSNIHRKYIWNKKNKKFFYCGNSSFNMDFINSNTINTHKKNIIYVGRNDNYQKNIDLLKEISLSCKYKILFYGTNKKSEFKEFTNIKVMGKYKTKDIPTIAKNGSIAIITSNFEGMPGVIMELNSFGIPYLIRDTFTEAINFCNNGFNILIKKNASIDEWQNKINLLMNSNIERNSLVNYSILNFSNEEFIKRWMVVLND